MLRTSDTAMTTVGQNRVTPSVYLSPTAQPISSSPARRLVVRPCSSFQRNARIGSSREH
jgi:hypothetical protein